MGLTGIILALAFVTEGQSSPPIDVIQFQHIREMAASAVPPNEKARRLRLLINKGTSRSEVTRMLGDAFCEFTTLYRTDLCYSTYQLRIAFTIDVVEPGNARLIEISGMTPSRSK